MESIDPTLQKEYERTIKRLSGKSAIQCPPFIDIETVLRAHFIICDVFIKEGHGIALAGVKDEKMLLSAIDRQLVGFEGQLKWADPIERCATLCYGLVKNHSFHDGNKRTGILVALYDLFRMNFKLKVGPRALEKLVVRTAANRLSNYGDYNEICSYSGVDKDVAYLAKFFSKNTKKNDNRQYIITFHQLKYILKRFGYDLQNPSNNRIDVVKGVEPAMSLKFWKKEKKIRYEKVYGIGFPGWTKQITKPELNRLRRELKLTAENGCDSQVFFKNAEPLESLIAEYSSLLKRLKDR